MAFHVRRRTGFDERQSVEPVAWERTHAEQPGPRDRVARAEVEHQLLAADESRPATRRCPVGEEGHRREGEACAVDMQPGRGESPAVGLAGRGDEGDLLTEVVATKATEAAGEHLRANNRIRHSSVAISAHDVVEQDGSASRVAAQVARSKAVEQLLLGRCIGPGHTAIIVS